MKFITDVTRDNICKAINSSSILLIAASRIFANNKKITFEILLMDYYNTLMIKKNMGTLDEDDIKFINLINSSKVEDLFYLSENPTFLKNAFIATVNFKSLTTLDKYQITNIAYQETDDNDLTQRPLYRLNLIASGLSNNVDDLLNYYKEYILLNGGSLINHDTARDIIFHHLQDIRQYDFNNYKNILHNAIPVYYKWGKYTVSKYKNEVDVTSRIFLKRIEWLKMNKLIELTKYDNDFLLDVITQYLYFGTISSSVVNEVEEYSNKKLSKRMKRKFESIDENKTTRN